MSSSIAQAEASISPIENLVPHPRANCIETEATVVPAETAQAEATVARPSAWQRVKSAHATLKAAQFSFREHGVVAILFALVILAPVVLASQNFALRLWIAAGPLSVIAAISILEGILVALCGVWLLGAARKVSK